MNWIRLFLRALFLAIEMPLFYLILLIGLLFFSFNKKLQRQWRNTFVMFWSKVTVALIGAKIIVKGTPPKEPFFLVCNHLGYLDIPVFFTQLHCVFVSRHDVANWPLIGFIARSINTLFINRQRKSDIPRVNNQINQVMAEKTGLIMFPEGTSSGGKDVLPFKAPLLEYPAQNNFPVSIASLHYRTGATDKPPQDVVCYWGDMSFVPHIFKLVACKKVEVIITFSQEKIICADRKELAQLAHKNVCSIFTPTSV